MYYEKLVDSDQTKIQTHGKFIVSAQNDFMKGLRTKFYLPGISITLEFKIFEAVCEKCRY